MKKWIRYFSKNHIFTNFLMAAVFILAVISWNKTGKEAMPNIEMDHVLISTRYAGATSEEMENLVTRPLEAALQGLDGVEQITSTSSQGSSSIKVDLEPDASEREQIKQEIEDAIQEVKLPDDLENEPKLKEFKSSRRSVISYSLYYQNINRMTGEQRMELQALIDQLEDRILKLPAVSEINLDGYLDQYIDIQLLPDQLSRYNISMQEAVTALQKMNLNQPLGSLDDLTDTKVRIDVRLNDIDQINNTIIQSNFMGNVVKIKDIARVQSVFTEPAKLSKTNGAQSITLKVTKTSSSGIIEAVDQINLTVDQFKQTVLKDSPIQLMAMEDNSSEVRSRLSLIAMNGLIGFGLILIILFIFLNVKSAFWVAMGIPFTFGFTMVLAALLGNTINNMTLAAVIIVMGMIVDDAIVVAENINRLKNQGLCNSEAVVKGTAAVLLPITASILTTCVAFVPLYFFQGRFGMLLIYIPPIIFLMLGGSLFESIFILPSHLNHQVPAWMRTVFSLGTWPLIEKYYARKKKNKTENRIAVPKDSHISWFYRLEQAFGTFLMQVLKRKWLVYLLFISLLGYAGWYFKTNLKYVMFPREETTKVNLSGMTPENTLKDETEKAVRKIEAVLKPYLGREIIAFNTSIGQTRRGGTARENVFSLKIELVSMEKRTKNTQQLINEWKEKLTSLPDIAALQFGKQRFGQSSGSAIDIVIKENNNETRSKIAREIIAYLNRLPSLVQPEIEPEIYYPQYNLKIDQDMLQRLGISVTTITDTLKIILDGKNIFDISGDEKDTEVFVSIDRKNRDIAGVLKLQVENNHGYLVPLDQIIQFDSRQTAASIIREDGKRTLHVYADLNQNKATGQAAQKGSIIRQDSGPDSSASSKKNLLKNAALVTQQSGLTFDSGRKRKKEQTQIQNPDTGKTGQSQSQPEMLDLPQEMTPLEIAAHLEKNLFPDLLKKYPTSDLAFAGEVANTRESNSDFLYAVVLALLLIYVILALSLNSMTKPLLIMLAIPFSLIGIVLIFQIHAISVYGFFTAIGAIGLAGVLVNDAIILLSRLEKEYPRQIGNGSPQQVIARISQTRLRAVLMTTLTTVAGLLPTAYGICGYDSMLAEMMLVMAWGLLFGTVITLILIPALYCSIKEISEKIRGEK